MVALWLCCRSALWFCFGIDFAGFGGCDVAYRFGCVSGLLLLAWVRIVVVVVDVVVLIWYFCGFFLGCVKVDLVACFWWVAGCAFLFCFAV